MVKKTLSAIIAVLLAAAVLASCAKAEKASSAQKQTKSETSPIPQAVTVPQETNSVEQVLASMTTEEKIEQMIMPSIRYNDNGDREYVTKITDDIRRSLKKHSYAGVILFGPNTGGNEQTLRLTDALQKANAAKGDCPQLLIATGQEGGTVSRLGQGTMMPGNMTLGAIDDLDATKEAATIIGRELDALEINVNLAPDVDINSNPANCVIGVRSFSDDPQMTAEQSVAYMNAVNDTGVISTLKHFPGHGDTDTDSHTGLPSINKTYEELRECELVPFEECFANGSEMIMTAHIQYPKIEKKPYVSEKTGKKIILPATLSKTIITDILRDDMGFDGVVMTDALDMHAIIENFGLTETAKLAINAGVDILLMPVTTYTTEGFRQMDKYIRELANLTDKGEIPIKAVDAAVTRILTLKDNNGLLDTYESSDIEERVEKAVSFVGSGTNHDKEWELTERGITLVKNESALPLTNSDEKTVVLVPYDEEITSINYAVNKLTADGKLPSGAAVEVYSYNNKTAKKVLPLIKGADNVIFVSEIYSADGLKNDVSYMADALTERAHANGARFIVMSASLPYDAARFQSSDAIMLAYMPCSMSSDPTGKETEIEQYGPNISAALYMMFSEDDAPSAKLPVDIPELDSTYSFTDSILYERGFGLTYE